MLVVWKEGASIASCRLWPCTRWRSRKTSCHCSCWSPPGEPHAITGRPCWRTRVGVSVVRGRRPGARDDGSPSSSQNICIRLPRQKPSSGIAGELCSHPPLGVAEIMLPHRSTTSTWQVSPRVTPVGATVGSPVVASSVALGRSCPWRTYAARRGSRPSGLPGRSVVDAVSPMSAARLAAYSVDRSVSIGTSTSPYHASRSAKESLSASVMAWIPSGSMGRGRRGRQAHRACAGSAAVPDPGPRAPSWRWCARASRSSSRPPTTRRTPPCRRPHEAGVRAPARVAERLAREGIDRFGDEALAPCAAGGVDLGLPRATRSRALVHEALEGVRIRRVGEERARLGHPAPAEPQVRGGRPVRLEQLAHRRDGGGDPAEERVAVPGVADRGLEDLGQGAGALVTQEQQPRRRPPRDRGGERPRAGNQVEPLGAVVRDGRARRRGTLPHRTPAASRPRAVAKIAGTSPPGPFRCGSTTWSTKPAATAASNALPPRSSTRPWRAAEASQCVEGDHAEVPSRVGRVVKVIPALCRRCCTVSDVRPVPSVVHEVAGHRGTAVDGPQRRHRGPPRAPGTATGHRGWKRHPDGGEHRAGAPRRRATIRAGRAAAVGIRPSAPRRAAPGCRVPRAAEERRLTRCPPRPVARGTSRRPGGEVLHRDQVVGHEQAGEAESACSRPSRFSTAACTDTSSALVGARRPRAGSARTSGRGPG